MKALSFWKAVTLDKSNFLEEVFALLQRQGVNFCVIGGQAVNAYVEPLVSLDLPRFFQPVITEDFKIAANSFGVR